MKKAVAAVLLLAAALLTLPWYLGGRAEASYRDALAQMSAQGMRLVDSRYERGWFGSQALAALESEPMAGGAHGGESLRLRIASRFLHGPWHLDAPRPMPVAAIVRSRVETVYPGMELPPLLVTSEIELDGRGVASLRIPAVERPVGFGMPGLRMSESRGEMHVGPGFDAVEGWYELPSLDVIADGVAAVSIQGLRSDTAGTRGVGGLFVGRGSVRIEQVLVHGPDGDVGIQGLSAVLESVPRDRLIDLRFEYDADSLKTAEQLYDSVRILLSVTSLPAEELAALRQAVAELPAGPSAGAEPVSAIVALLTRFLPPLLARDPQVALERLAFTAPGGKVEARLSVGTHGMTREVVERPGAWLSHLMGEGELRVPKSLLLSLLTQWHRGQALDALRNRDPGLAELPPELEPGIGDAARDQLDVLLRGGWAAEQSGQIQTNLRLADAILTVNGKTFPLTGIALP